jgi:hypothetical protein
MSADIVEMKWSSNKVKQSNNTSCDRILRHINEFRLRYVSFFLLERTHDTVSLFFLEQNGSR